MFSKLNTVPSNLKSKNAEDKTESSNLTKVKLENIFKDVKNDHYPWDWYPKNEKFVFLKVIQLVYPNRNEGLYFSTDEAHLLSTLFLLYSKRLLTDEIFGLL